MAASATAASLIAACSGRHSSDASCESLPRADGYDDEDGGGGDDDDDLPPNPLWPSGVPQSMVDSFVDEILSDPDINIAAIPDSIERQIYVSTVLLTLNAVYESVGGFHGMEILGHRIELHRIDGGDGAASGGDGELGDGGEKVGGATGAVPEAVDGSVKKRVKQAYASNAYGPGSIDHAALESVADRLLANKAVNQPLVPDIVERQLYVNCLKLVFRLLDAVASTLRCTLCGHDVRIHFEPCADQTTRQWIQDRLRKRASAKSSQLTEVDLSAVERYAREVGAAPVDQELSWIGRLLDYGQREMAVQLNKTLYALVLGILDDLLEDTVLTFLSDRIRLDVVPKKEKKRGDKFITGAAAKKDRAPVRDVGDGDVADLMAAFTFGVGVGAVAVSYAGKK